MFSSLSQQLSRAIHPPRSYAVISPDSSRSAVFFLGPFLLELLGLPTDTDGLNIFKLWNIIEKRAVSGKKWCEDLRHLRFDVLLRLDNMGGSGLESSYNAVAAQVARATDFGIQARVLYKMPRLPQHHKMAAWEIVDYEIPVKGSGEVRIETTNFGTVTIQQEDFETYHIPTQVRICRLPCPAGEPYSFESGEVVAEYGKYALHNDMQRLLQLTENPTPMGTLWKTLQHQKGSSKGLSPWHLWDRYELEQDILDRMYKIILGPAVDHDVRSQNVKRLCLLLFCLSPKSDRIFKHAMIDGRLIQNVEDFTDETAQYKSMVRINYSSCGPLTHYLDDSTLLEMSISLDIIDREGHPRHIETPFISMRGVVA